MKKIIESLLLGFGTSTLGFGILWIVGGKDAIFGSDPFIVYPILIIIIGLFLSFIFNVNEDAASD